MNDQIKLKQGIKNIWDVVKFAIIALLIVIPIRIFVAQPFVVSGESMYPTFHNGEYLIVDELSYNIGNPVRGDVVIFRYPNDQKRFFIKRIIGLPNETLIINEDQIKIINESNPDGFILEEPYIAEKFSSTGEYKTGNSEYFVMGDNRNRSSDSRFWGVLPEKLLVGRAYLRLLPIKNVSYLPGSLQEFQIVNQ
jgi:signal peptidase I